MVREEIRKMVEAHRNAPPKSSLEAASKFLHSYFFDDSVEEATDYAGDSC